MTWTQWFTDAGAARVDLPTYAFQHQRYWLGAGQTRTADVSGAGLGVAGHPLLGAAVSVAGEDMVVLTGRLDVDARVARRPRRLRHGDRAGYRPRGTGGPGG
ncbi:hypothetical protein V2I01_30905 [Micromonospora sp. BRA006-A]|nr:hypothetical protein [Micromonospora sp. BRA006-A]